MLAGNFVSFSLLLSFILTDSDTQFRPCAGRSFRGLTVLSSEGTFNKEERMRSVQVGLLPEADRRSRYVFSDEIGCCLCDLLSSLYP